jgi:hypothetical protein
MKTTLKLMTAIVLASTAIASQASAATLGQERLAERNSAYFGNKASSAVIAPSAYDTVTTPQQRLGQRNAEYWAKTGTGKTVSQSPSMAEPMPSHPTKR